MTKLNQELVRGKSVGTGPQSSNGRASVSAKVLPRHTERQAIVYIRQSSARQVQENTESTALQYRLTERAVQLGWPTARVVTIDDDLGLSGRTAEARLGFQRLLGEVSMDHVGIVLGIEMSRLARSCKDWHHLLEVCGLFGTLLGDADGVYDPRDYNDRLLLGLKGTMSEAELHILRSRLDAGRNNKARRGDLFTHAPIGYQRTREGLVLEPDIGARSVVQLLFDKFVELGSVSQVLKYVRREGIQIPWRPHRGPERDQLTWRRPTNPTLQSLFHHPIYAGAYVYGRRKTDARKIIPGRPGTGRGWASPDEWLVLIRDALPAYISWEQWEKNQLQLRENSTRYGVGAPRGGALLSGRVRCGRCGKMMSVSYANQHRARFTCDAARNQWGDDQCQAFTASPLEKLVEQQVLRAIEPMSLQLSLEAADQIEADRRRIEQHHERNVERAKHQSDVARRRLLAVDPENRLVAAELERDWEKVLTQQRQLEDQLDRLRHERPAKLGNTEHQRVTALATQLPALWHAPTTRGEQRQRVVRTLIDSIEATVIGTSERVAITIHWAGDFVSQHEIRRRVGSYLKLEVGTQMIQRLLALRAEGWSRKEIAVRLNQESFTTASGKPFTEPIITNLLQSAVRSGLTSIRRTLPKHLHRPTNLAGQLRTTTEQIQRWRKRGWVQGIQNGRRWMYLADEPEMKRLRQLASYVRKLQKPPPALTKPIPISR